MEKRLIAKVYVEKAIYRIDMAFDYLVPSEFSNSLKKGCRVLVPFGNANNKIQGLVSQICEVNSIDKNVKPIYSQIDEQPMVTDEMFSIINFLVKTTFCTYYEAVKSILPIGSNVDVSEKYKLVSNISEMELITYSESERRLIDFLKTAKTSKEIAKFLETTSNPSKKPIIKSLLNNNIIEKCEIIKQRVPQKTQRMVKLYDKYDPSLLKLSKNQTEVCNKLSEVKNATPKEICYLCGVKIGVINNLAKRGIVEFYDCDIKTKYEDVNIDFGKIADINLSEQQKVAFDGIIELANGQKPNVALLYGITGSGKTQVYIKLIENILAKDKTAILLVPEIALTPQMVNKFDFLFGNIVAVINSSLTLSQRLDTFEQIRQKKKKIVIGTRSAIFAPLENIGIIILDEEGENSYKSDSSPRYHAREIAKFRCVKNNATLLLGSATPSIDTYYQAQKGVYSFFKLDERYSTAILPSVAVIDMFDELQNGNDSSISIMLQQQLKINLENNQQSMLLINRRGYNTVAVCMECGAVIKCENCDIAMTYHKVNGCLMCHYCGKVSKFDSVCQECNGKYIKLTGAGTQKLEDEIKTLLPDARVLRMDTDTTFSRFSYEEKFNEFRQNKYDIMIGTQMIAKGLDFQNVTLVGVLNADSGLFSTDFRSSERVFSLITQVIGRSGRGEKQGRAYVQTLEPHNSVIDFASKQDYEGFFNEEIKTRKLMTYPPYCDICTLIFSGMKEQLVVNATSCAMQILRDIAVDFQGITIKVLGVSKANIVKINNKYRYRIIIKCKFNKQFREYLSQVLKKCLNDRNFRLVSLAADINGELN